MWVYDINNENGRCIDLEGCKQIIKTTWLKEDGHDYNTFRIHFTYTKGSIDWDYNSDHERNLAHKHFISVLRPFEMDSKKEPIVL